MMKVFSVLILAVVLYGDQATTEGKIIQSQARSWSQTGTNRGTVIRSGNTCGCAHGSCVSMTVSGVHTEYCNCNYGWSGQKCDSQSWNHQQSSSQSGNQCGCVHGTCHYVSRPYYHTECSCYYGWSGSKCNIDACASNPCHHGGSCATSRQHHPPFTCSCMDGYYGDHCQYEHAHTTVQPSTIKTTTTTITVAPTTMPQNYNTCSKWTTVTQIADEVTVRHNSARMCPTGSTASPEAVVLVHCQVNGPSTWSRGANVYDHCSEIPLYTPVAGFSDNGQYDGNTAWSGIFVGCLTDGFRLAHQLCDQPANFTHVVTGGTGNMDPTTYYTIQ